MKRFSYNYFLPFFFFTEIICQSSLWKYCRKSWWIGIQTWWYFNHHWTGYRWFNRMVVMYIKRQTGNKYFYFIFHIHTLTYIDTIIYVETKNILRGWFFFLFFFPPPKYGMRYVCCSIVPIYKILECRQKYNIYSILINLWCFFFFQFLMSVYYRENVLQEKCFTIEFSMWRGKKYCFLLLSNSLHSSYSIFKSIFFFLEISLENWYMSGKISIQYPFVVRFNHFPENS